MTFGSQELTLWFVQKYPGSVSQTLSRVQISTLAVRDGLMAAGGFQGELICKVG